MWRFLQVSDPHLASLTDGQWNNNFICTMMPDVMRCLRRDVAKLDPDFILATGDIVSQDTRDAMFAARDLMDSLGVPYYPMGGNHDFVLPESREWFLEAFRAHLPVLDTVYSFTHKNLHFCVLDPWWQWKDGTLCPYIEGPSAGASWAVTPHQLRWLEDDLQAHSTLPTLIAVHYPAVQIPARMQRPGMRNAGSLANGALLIELLKGYPQVKGVISGHLHMNFIVTVNGLTHIVTGSLPEYPTEYREYQVYDDRIEVFTHGLSDPSFASRSLISGKDWTQGEVEDRTGIIRLT
ncbi:MAG: metallophosphoesterase [Candidatus Hydrogenedentes bacterium]|nr:metallophosphoesterase [Candidatus Hydrogenedentota bacterium]